MRPCQVLVQPAAMELRVGKKYRLSKKIGGGSFGDIFHGEPPMRAPRNMGLCVCKPPQEAFSPTSRDLSGHLCLAVPAGRRSTLSVAIKSHDNGIAVLPQYRASPRAPSDGGHLRLAPSY